MSEHKGLVQAVVSEGKASLICRLAAVHAGRGALMLCSLLLFVGAQGLSFPPVIEEQASPVTLPPGTVLYLRLENRVSTTGSHLRDPITAQVVREIQRPGSREVLIPLGSVVRGHIEKLIPSSSPEDRARVRLKFTGLQIPGGAELGLTGHIAEVENARETVLPDGTIQGLLASELPLTHLEQALRKLKRDAPDVGAGAEKAQKELLGESDASIDFPAGTDLQWVLEEPLAIDRTFPPAVSSQLSPAAADSVARLLAEAPQRAASKEGKPGDPLNLLVVGGAGEIREAFEEARWAEAEKLTGNSVWETVRAVIANRGYRTAPVSQLYLFGRGEDLAFQKMLNTFAERHHLRLWRSGATSTDGREIWLAAATHDVGWDVRPEQGVVSHAIDPEIDRERDKVGSDLAVTGRVSARRLVTRPNPLSEGLTATGATWKTDGQLLAIELKGE